MRKVFMLIMVIVFCISGLDAKHKYKNKGLKDAFKKYEWEIQTGIATPLSNSNFFVAGPMVMIGQKHYLNNWLYYHIAIGGGYFFSKLNWMNGKQLVFPLTISMGADFFKWDKGYTYARLGYSGLYQYTKFSDFTPIYSDGNGSGLMFTIGENFIKFNDKNIGLALTYLIYTQPDKIDQLGSSMYLFNIVFNF